MLKGELRAPMNNNNLLQDMSEMIIKKNQLVILILFCIMCLFAGCSDKDTHNQISQETDNHLTIACTIPPQEEFIKAIGGDSVTVQIMVPPGASPHTFEPTPSQISHLENADLYIILGSGIEFENRWISRIRTMFPNLILVNSSERIQLRHESEDHHHESSSDSEDQEESIDPHIWLSIKNTMEIVNTTCDAMSQLRPSQKGVFEQNRDRYLARLITLDSKITETLTTIPSRTILVYHPAFGYFCQDYNLTQLAVEEEGKEPSSQSLAKLIAKARSENITLIFTEPEFSTRGAETLATEINGTLVLITPLSGEYLTNMQHIADSIAKGNR